MLRKAAAFLGTALVIFLMLSASVRAPPKMFIVNVTVTEGAPVEGAVVNITNLRNGLRWSGATDAEGVFQVSVPFEDPPGEMVRNDRVAVTAAKGGLLGLAEITMEPDYAPTKRLEIVLKTDNTAPSPVVLSTPVAEYTYMDVRWSRSQDSDFGMYVLYLSREENALGDDVWRSADITRNITRVANLESGTKYYLRMAVVDAAGALALSNPVSASTKGVSQGTVIYALLAVLGIAALLIAAILLRRRRRPKDESRKAKRQ